MPVKGQLQTNIETALIFNFIHLETVKKRKKKTELYK